jgi:hypothetical protein
MSKLLRFGVTCALFAALLGSNDVLAGDLIYFNEIGGPGGTPQLYDFVPSSGVSTLRLNLPGSQRIFSLETQPSTGTTYAVEPTNSDLYTLDLNTGVATFVAHTFLSSLANIAFDPSTGTLYATSRANGNLYKVDHATGTSVLIGNLGSVRHGLAFSPGGVLYSFTLDGAMYQVDKTTGVTTFVGGGGTIGLLEDAAFTAAGKLYVTDYYGKLFEINPVNGASTLVGLTNLGNGLLGLVEEPAGCPVAAYCVAKVNSLGCTPAIGFTGVPSASAGSGFTVKCTQVRNNKSGLLFYGNGQAGIAFQCGTLCVKSPIKRTPVQLSGGTPAPANDCSGLYSLDMNAFAVGSLGGSPAPYLTIVGTLVDCQWWGRDPGFAAPCNTTLSNALEYTVCP